MIINNKETTLLGLLNERPMYGYEIENQVKQRSMRYWSEISIASIYKVLKKLEEKGFVKIEVKLTSNNVTQKISHITKKGRTALKKKVYSLFTDFDHHRWEIDLAVNNLDILTREEAENAVKEYIKKLEKLYKGYGDLEKYLKDNDCPSFRMALAVRPQYMYKAEIEWAKEYLKVINQIK